MKKLLFIVMLAMATFFSGCAAIGNWTADNEAVVDIAVRQAVFRYIDAGDTQADKDKRAGAVLDVVRKVDDYLEGNPTAGPDVLLVVIDSQIRWDKLEPQDAMLLRDVMTLIRHNLQNRQSEGLLDADAVVSIRALLQTAIQTASML